MKTKKLIVIASPRGRETSINLQVFFLPATADNKRFASRTLRAIPTLPQLHKPKTLSAHYRILKKKEGGL
jgi:hypothetical protein